MSFFKDTATTGICTLSLHDSLPIYGTADAQRGAVPRDLRPALGAQPADRAIRPDRAVLRQIGAAAFGRSEEHTSELQSRQYLVGRLLLEENRHTEGLAVLRKHPAVT